MQIAKQNPAYSFITKKPASKGAGFFYSYNQKLFRLVRKIKANAKNNTSCYSSSFFVTIFISLV